MTKTKTQHKHRKSALILIILLLAIYVLLPQLQSFKNSLRTIIDADLTYLLLAVIFFCGTYFAATISYQMITYFKLRFWPTLLIQIADGFTNRITPAGLGAITTNFLYLSKQSKSKLKAGYVAVLNNIIGFIGHIILLTCLLFINRQNPSQIIHVDLSSFKLTFIILLSLLILIPIVYWRHIKTIYTKTIHDLAKALKTSFRKPLKLVGGLLTSIVVTLFYALCLYAVMYALNLHLSFLQTFLALTVSVIAMTVSPTPGGLGVVEAGLTATLIAFGVSPSQALSAALLYRLITYWLPILPGSIALHVAARKGFLTGH